MTGLAIVQLVLSITLNMKRTGIMFHQTSVQDMMSLFTLSRQKH